MRLSDIMSNAGLAGYAEVALILFFVAFVIVLARVMWPSRQADVERDRMIPFEEDLPSHPQPGGRR